MLRLATAAGLMLSWHAFGQTTAARPEFEVASIKRNNSGNIGMMISPRPGGRFVARNVPIEALIAFAYRIQDFQLSGAPVWLKSERYDLEAKAEGDASFQANVARLQTLLENRLQFKFHRETKEEPAYALVVVKTEKLPDAGACGPPPSSPPPPPKPGTMPPPGCGNIATLIGHITAEKVPLSSFIDVISRLTDRKVFDQTNLTGRYNIDLEYAPDQAEFPPGAPPRPPIDDRPSLFTALQEQLGLKLESTKGPVDVFVIDHIERPSEN